MHAFLAHDALGSCVNPDRIQHPIFIVSNDMLCSTELHVGTLACESRHAVIFTANDSPPPGPQCACVHTP